jgi:superfamily II DNA or RNA helicase
MPSDRARQLAHAIGLADEHELQARLQELDVSARRTRNDLNKFFGITEASRNISTESHRTAGIVSASFGLFSYQRTVVRELLCALDSTPRRVVLHLPTGAGKTRVAMNVICEYLRKHDPGVVLWLAYSRELLDQAASAFESAWNALGNRDLPVVRYWGPSEHEFTGTSDALIVAGLGKLDALGNRDYQALARLADQTILTVMDEAHQSIAHTYRQLLELFATKRLDSRLLGLTATPGRTWADIDADAELAAFYKHQKVTLQPEGYDDPITFLINEGYLARPTFVTLNVDAGLTVTNQDLKALSANLDIPAYLLQQLAESQQRNLRILESAERLLLQHRRVILFATTVSHARLLAAILRARGHRAEAITAETSWADRESAIQRFRSNSRTPMILCNYGVLTTGFDAPTTSAALIARPTRSLVLYSQMVGRAIRGPRSGGNAEAEIVTVADLELPGFGEIIDAFTNWEDVWR